MSTNPKVMHSMRCDHPDGCSAELETYDGGSWLYDTAEEARNAARDYDWVTDGERDFCDRHRDDLLEAADQSFCPPLEPGDDETCTHTPTCPTGSAEQ